MHLTDLLSPFAKRWLKRVQSELDVVPSPVDAPRRVVAGPRPDRVLLLGNGPVIGFGVRTQEFALPGQLARRLAAATGRGAVVDVVAQRGLRVGQAAALLRDRRPGLYDAVVLGVGATDAAGLLPTARWRTGLELLLDDVAALVADGSVIAVLAADPLQRTSGTAGRRRHLSDAHAKALDAVTAEVCAARGLPFVQQTGATDAPRTPEDYAALAARIASALAGPLDRLLHLESSATARRQRRTADPELLRQSALERTGLSGSGTNAVLDRLLQQARDLFGAGAAAVTLIDGDRVAYKASTGVDRGSAPRALAPCNRTIRQDGPMLVPDLAGEPIAEHGWRFYAGHPLESPDGYRIGTLCVLDHDPRPVSELDGVALIELAARVQAELWREIEHGPRSPDEVRIDAGPARLPSRPATDRRRASGSPSADDGILRAESRHP